MDTELFLLYASVKSSIVKIFSQYTDSTSLGIYIKGWLIWKFFKIFYHMHAYWHNTKETKKILRKSLYLLHSTSDKIPRI
jgi:hypothetical protein